MPLTKTVRASFAQRFNPHDPSTLFPGDEEAFLDLLFTGKIWGYRSLNARLLLPLEAAWMLRYLHAAERRSWHVRISALRSATVHQSFWDSLWVVACASEAAPEVLEKAREARRVAVEAHGARFKQGRGYAKLRRKRKRAYHTFMRTALPAVRSGLYAYAFIICSR